MINHYVPLLLSNQSPPSQIWSPVYHYIPLGAHWVAGGWTQSRSPTPEDLAVWDKVITQAGWPVDALEVNVWMMALYYGGMMVDDGWCWLMILDDDDDDDDGYFSWLHMGEHMA